MRHPSATVVALACLVAAGCGDDAPETPDAGPPAIDQCLDPTDRMIIDSLTPDGGGAPGEFVGLMRLVEECGRGPCLDTVLSGSEGDLVACVNTCLDGTVAAAVSTSCRQCYQDTLVCVKESCLLICLGNDLVLCGSCLEEECYPALDLCKGF